jgi:hypothetical protein
VAESEDPTTYVVAVPPKRQLSSEDARTAVHSLLAAIEAGQEVFVALDEVRSLHPKNDTFPGEVFLRLAVDALDLAGVGRDSPIPEEGLVKLYLPECHFRGRDNRKIRYAIMAVAAMRGGLDVSLLDEVVYWESDDFWIYAGFAAAAWIRATADHRALSVAELSRELRDRN